MANIVSMPVLYGICIGLGLAVMTQSGSSGSAFQPELVQCYPSPAPSTASTLPSAADIERAAVALRSARDAANACRTDRCDRQTRHALKYSLTEYLARRQAITSVLYWREGDAGLAEATRLFSTPDNVRLADDVAALYAQGTLASDDLPEDRHALALVMMKQAASFKPCLALHRSSPTVAPYVY